MARIKKSFASSQEVAHIFAYRSQEEAYCRNTSIYHYTYGSEVVWKYKSYNAIIAEYVTNEKGETAVMFNSYYKDYSNTTRKHMNEVRGACQHLTRFWTGETNLEEVYQSVRELVCFKIPTARTKLPQYIAEAKRLFNTFLQYKSWKSSDKSFKDWDTFKQLLEIIAELDSPEMVARIEKETEKAVIREEKQRARKLEEQAELLLTYQEQVAKWLSFEMSSITVWGLDSSIREDFLRISKDGQFVETTQRVKIPVAAATLLYKMILAGKDIKGYNIEGYIVRSLNGHLVVGCHNINVENMHKVGKKLLE